MARQAHWSGKVPVFISLADADAADDIDTHSALPLMLARCSYLPLHLDEIHRHFAELAKVGSLEKIKEVRCWFSCKHLPVQWHLPVGALYDILASSPSPLHLRLHYSAFPHDRLLPLGGQDTDSVRLQFLNSLKESLFLRTGTTAVMNEISSSLLERLWHSVVAVDVGAYFQIVDPLYFNSTQAKYIPVRIFTKGNAESPKQPLITVAAGTTTPLPAAHQVGGVECPEGITYAYASQHLIYPDGFLYVIE